MQGTLDVRVAAVSGLLAAFAFQVLLLMTLAVGFDRQLARQWCPRMP